MSRTEFHLPSAAEAAGKIAPMSKHDGATDPGNFAPKQPAFRSLQDKMAARLLSLLCLLFFGARAQAEHQITPEERQNQILRAVATFEEGGNEVLLIENSLWFRGSSHQPPRGFEASYLAVWIELLNALEAKIDPAYQPKNYPIRDPDPPAGSGVQAGESPSDVKDPKLRLEYQAILRANSEYATYYGHQFKYRELKQRFLEEFRGFLSAAFPKSASIATVAQTLRQNLADRQTGDALAKEIEPK